MTRLRDALGYSVLLFLLVCTVLLLVRLVQVGWVS